MSAAPVHTNTHTKSFCQQVSHKNVVSMYNYLDFTHPHNQIIKHGAQ